MGSQIIIALPVSPCLCSRQCEISKAFLEWTDKSKIEILLQNPWNYQNTFQNVSKQGSEYHPDSQGQVTLKQSYQSFLWKSNSWTILKCILDSYWVIWNKLIKSSFNFHFQLSLCPHMFSCNSPPHFSNVSLSFPNYADSVFLWFSGSSRFTGGCNTSSLLKESFPVISPFISYKSNLWSWISTLKCLIFSFYNN